MNKFVYDIPTKVYFGKDQIGNLGKELSKFGKRVLLTYGGGSIKKIGLYDAVVEQIKEAGLELFELSGIEPNPRVDSVREGAQICKDQNIDVLLAVVYIVLVTIAVFLTFFSCHPLVGFNWRLILFPIIHVCTRLVYIFR